MLYKGNEEDVLKVYESVKSIGIVYGYKKSDNEIKFDFISGASELPLDVTTTQRPGYYRINAGFGFVHSFQSPKNFLYPPRTDIAIVTENLYVEVLENNIKSVVLFGVKPCDLAAIRVFDELFASNFNPYYFNRRRGIAGIVVEECLYPSETCFCGSVGTGPDVTDGFDLAFARIDRDFVLFKVGSSFGKIIVNKLRLERANESDVGVYRKLVEEAKKKTSIGISVEDMQKALSISIPNEHLWRKLSEKCLGCANCNMVCPTCFCTEIVDEIENDRSRRIAQWIGCLSYIYGLVAGGHFRKELYTRYRHFVLHKFLFYPKQTGLLGCVGCGRCIVWCPVGIDIRETIKSVVNEYGEKHG
ncbi:MAG: 4Fe-4S dicluster domain-containing protein [Ignisphaera sp.]